MRKYRVITIVGFLAIFLIIGIKGFGGDRPAINYTGTSNSANSLVPTPTLTVSNSLSTAEVTVKSNFLH